MVIVFTFQKFSMRIENAAAAVTRLADRDEVIKPHDSTSLQRTDSELHGIFYQIVVVESIRAF